MLMQQVILKSEKTVEFGAVNGSNDGSRMEVMGGGNKILDDKNEVVFDVFSSGLSSYKNLRFHWKNFDENEVVFDAFVLRRNTKKPIICITVYYVIRRNTKKVPQEIEPSLILCVKNAKFVLLCNTSDFRLARMKGGHLYCIVLYYNLPTYLLTI